MGKLEVDQTIVAQAVSKSSSVRSTIPRHIAKKLGLRPGVHVRWDVDKVDGTWVAIVRVAPTDS